MKILQNPDPFAKKLLFYSLGVGAVSAVTAQGAVVSTTSGLTANNIAFSLQNTITPTSASTANSAMGVTGAQFALTTSGSNKGAGTNSATGHTGGNYLVETTSKTGTGGTAVNYALDLATGTTIGSSATFTTAGVLNNTTTGNGSFSNGTTGFIGFEILATAPNNVSGTNEFGYANITVNNFTSAAPGSFTLNYYAYENTGAAIVTAAVPEPTSTAALLVAGAAGIAALRVAKSRSKGTSAA